MIATYALWTWPKLQTPRHIALRDHQGDMGAIVEEFRFAPFPNHCIGFLRWFLLFMVGFCALSLTLKLRPNVMEVELLKSFWNVWVLVHQVLGTNARWPKIVGEVGTVGGYWPCHVVVCVQAGGHCYKSWVEFLLSGGAWSGTQVVSLGKKLWFTRNGGTWLQQ